ncbi:nucleolar complex protein 2 [Meira miltonrushii]|uniref:Nucleolar complex protein 2 n=1 Tax=Meira miltonrushii TaxID=1280837 RepID=A0A316VD52_9BASI|nr:nucleolar complex protein 2 [Meira miltonrushii]PWN35579.1 nucleolar complex protein 2 [Meira miltonrushii]
MAKQAKRTKKFIKNKLDSSLKNRKENKKKSAQIERSKKNKEARTAFKGSSNGNHASEQDLTVEAGSDEDAEDVDEIAKPRKAGGRMTVDEFMGGGFKGLEGAGKGEAEDESDEDDEEEDYDSDDDDLEDVEDLSDEEDEGRDHAQDLAKLAERDPEFFKYLQENDQELLQFGGEEEGNDGSEDEEDVEMTDKKGKGKAVSESRSENVTSDMLKQWQKSILTTHSLRAFRKLLLAFRAAAHMGADDAANLAYSVNNAAVFNKLIMTTLKYVPVVLQHHIGYKQLPSGKYKLPSNSKKFAALQKSVQSFFLSLHRLLRTLPEHKLLYVCVDESAKMIPYILQNRRVARQHAKILLELWSTAEENVRIAAFLSLRKMAAAGDEALLELCLHGAYRGIVRGSKAMTVHSLANINLMKNSASELFSIDLNASYQQAFGFIRQLAIHLRACLKNKTQESYQAVYNWQYVHCIDFWSIVLATTCDKERVAEQGQASIMQPLIYPLVQAATGAIGLIPTSRYFPLRLHIVQSLLRLMQRTGTYIPLAPILLEMLDAPEFMPRKSKASTALPLQMDLLIRAPKSHLRTKVYADQLAEDLSFRLLEFLATLSRSIAFPELVIPILSALRRSIKTAKGQQNSNKNSRDQSKFVGTLRNLIEKIERHSDQIRSNRNGVEFAPRDQDQVAKFLSDHKQELPVEAALRLARKVRTDKEALLKQSQIEVSQDGEEEASEDEEMSDLEEDLELDEDEED